jgi:hypothetical protein
MVGHIELASDQYKIVSPYNGMMDWLNEHGKWYDNITSDCWKPCENFWLLETL